MTPITLAFMYYRDFLDELERCEIEHCRLQPLIVVEPMENAPGFTHTWTVILTVYGGKAAAGVDVILAARLYAGDAWAGSAATTNVPGLQDIDLTMAVELTATALAEAGIDVYPGFYTHDVFGYGAAPSLWYFQDGRLVAGALPEETLDDTR